jgi:hypothetical protein
VKEPVHTVDDYYDGARRGIAEFEGNPHYYECQFDVDRHEYSSVFRLTPITNEVFELAMERNRIWLRWSAAFKNGQVTIETHPALPEERPRYDELTRILDDHVAGARTASFLAEGIFVHERPIPLGDNVSGSVKAEWSRLP